MASFFSRIFGKRGQVAEAGQSSSDSASRPSSDGDSMLSSAETPPRSPEVVVKEEPWPWTSERIRTIGGIYELRGKLGKGGMGYVYLADDTATHRRVAVKVPARSFVDRAASRKRLTHEVEEWRRLCHPNIVQPIDLWDDQSTDYLPAIVMEFCDGGSLAERMSQLSLAQKLDVLIQVCWGMEYAHGMGVIHRDLKPANVLMMKDGRALVSDFGLVKSLGLEQLEEGLPDRSGRLPLEVSSACGTPAYMAPEQWNGKAEAVSDVYAFGVMMYELLCGRRPFHGTNADLRKLHANGVAPNPRGLPASLRDGLAEMMLRCLDKNPWNRPRTFGEVAQEISVAHEHLTGGSHAQVRKKPGQVELSREARITQGWALLRLGIGCMRRGELKDALRQFTKAEEVFTETGHHAGVSRSLGKQALVLRDWGRLEDALALHRKQEQICKAQSDDAGLQASFGGQALILRMYGRLEEAMKLHEHEEQICRKLNDREGLARSLGNQALILTSWARAGEAMKRLQDQEAICREMRDQAGLQSTLFNQALIRKSWGRTAEAMKLLKDQEQISRDLGDRAALAASLGSQAEILREWGRREEAMKTSTEQQQIIEELRKKEGLQLIEGYRSSDVRSNPSPLAVEKSIATSADSPSAPIWASRVLRADEGISVSVPPTAPGISRWDPCLLLDLAQQCSSAGDWHGAESWATWVLAADSTNVKAYKIRANARSMIGKLTEAIDDYTHVIASGGADYRTWLNRGACSSRVAAQEQHYGRAMEFIAQAKADYQRALALNPGDNVTFLALVELELCAGSYQEAAMNAEARWPVLVEAEHKMICAWLGATAMALAGEPRASWSAFERYFDTVRHQHIVTSWVATEVERHLQFLANKGDSEALDEARHIQTLFRPHAAVDPNAGSSG